MTELLTLGSIGERVADLQRRLGITADGHFGPKTRVAVLEAQRQYGLVADGVAGPKTLAAMDGQNVGRLLHQSDIERAADTLGVSTAAIMAVNAVESRGMGFLRDSGSPVILFERHVMFRRLKANGFDALAFEQEQPDIVNRKRGGYLGGLAEHHRLERAARIDRDSAIESASWGLFQIMGFHWRTLEYAGAPDWVAAMSRDEGSQLDAFVAFIVNDVRLHNALLTLDWANFARLYNGPAYRENMYDVKLARVYERFNREALT